MEPVTPSLLISLSSALGIGLLMGAERERSKGDGGQASIAGLRTFALVALIGAVAQLLGPWMVLVGAFGTVLLTAVAYRQAAATDPGLTTEVALLLAFLLGAFAIPQPGLAAALAVVATVLLAAKVYLHRFTRELVTEREAADGLMLLAAALVVLPLLPDAAVDPWGVLRPSAIWRLVVLVMAVGVLGHVALRAIGARWGLPVAGFFAGFVSSTAAVAGFGQRARENPALRTSCIAAAMLANLGSMLLMLGVVGTLAPSLLETAWLPLGAASAVLLAGGLLGVWHASLDSSQLPNEPNSRAFRLSHALIFAAIIATVLLLSAALQQWLGPRGALAVATVAALAEWHAAAATVAQLASGGALSLDQARFGLVLLLLASALSKSVLAVLSGGPAYGLRVAAGLGAMCLAASLSLLAA